MRFPKLRWALLVGALVGGLVPLLFFTVPRFQHFITTSNGILLWPSGIWLIATDGREHELVAYEIIAVSILANVLIYSTVFTFIWCIGWILRAWRSSLRDGTTI